MRIRLLIGFSSLAVACKRQRCELGLDDYDIPPVCVGSGGPRRLDGQTRYGRFSCRRKCVQSMEEMLL